MPASGAFGQVYVVDRDDAYCWGENVGYLNWAPLSQAAGDLNPMFRFSAGFAEGFVWAENVGWINLGVGNGPYDNTDGASFGVNIDSNGNLSGWAWGENVGWIRFDPAIPLPPRLDLTVRRLRGFVWGENTGWINFDDSNAFVSVRIAPCGISDISEIGGTSQAPGGPDGQLTVDDLIVFVNVFGDSPSCPGTAPCSVADIAGIGGPPAPPDGELTVDDLIAFVNAFGEGC